MGKRGLRLVEKKKKKKNRYGLMIALCILVIFIAVVIFIGIYFTTEQVRVTGNETYTEEEVIHGVKSEGYIPNTLVMTLKSKLLPKQYLPFGDSVTLTFQDPNILEVKIKEKVRAGAVKSGKNYYYFNLAGVILEEKSTLYSGVPVVNSSEMGKLKTGQSLPLEEDLREEIVAVAKGLSNYNMDVSEIIADEKGEITLISGEYKIILGSADYLDAKISKAPEVLKSIEAEYPSGTIDMRMYTDDNEIITYFK